MTFMDLQVTPQQSWIFKSLLNNHGSSSHSSTIMDNHGLSSHSTTIMNIHGLSSHSTTILDMIGSNYVDLWVQPCIVLDEQSILFETSRPQRPFSEPTHLPIEIYTWEASKTMDYKSVFTNLCLVLQQNRSWIKGLGKNPFTHSIPFTHSLTAVPFVRGHRSVFPRTPRNTGVYTHHPTFVTATSGVLTRLPAKLSKNGMLFNRRLKKKLRVYTASEAKGLTIMDFRVTPQQSWTFMDFFPIMHGICQNAYMPYVVLSHNIWVKCGVE